jgi:hypothetical protein
MSIQNWDLSRKNGPTKIDDTNRNFPIFVDHLGIQPFFVADLVGSIWFFSLVQTWDIWVSKMLSSQNGDFTMDRGTHEQRRWFCSESGYICIFPQKTLPCFLVGNVDKPSDFGVFRQAHIRREILDTPFGLSHGVHFGNHWVHLLYLWDPPGRWQEHAQGMKFFNA